jgi:sigma-B regulation protein RsbU (phosphoserine phosphatase)
VNRAFTAEHFISMVYVELLQSDRGLVLYVNAGHNQPILLRSGTNQTEMIPSTGQLLGPFPNEKYRSDFTLVGKGDILLLYTDGIVEAQNEQQEPYGEQRLIHVLQKHRARTPKEICQLLLEDVVTYSKNPMYSDDKTLVVIKRTR